MPDMRSTTPAPDPAQRKPSTLELAMIGAPALAFASFLIVTLATESIDAGLIAGIAGLAVIPALWGLGSMAVVVLDMLHAISERIEVRTGLDLDRDGTIGPRETIRMIPVRAQSTGPLLSMGETGGYLPHDLAAMIELAYRGKPAREFVGLALPSGRVLTDYATDVVPFFDMMERAGFATGREPRKQAQMLGTAQEARRAMGV